MKNKKGFTLVELLAVIVILGILLVIAVPAVSKIIETSRNNAFRSQAKLYVDAVKKEMILEDDGESKIYNIKKLEGARASDTGYVVAEYDSTNSKYNYSIYLEDTNQKIRIGSKEGSKVITVADTSIDSTTPEESDDSGTIPTNVEVNNIIYEVPGENQKYISANKEDFIIGDKVKVKTKEGKDLACGIVLNKDKSSDSTEIVLISKYNSGKSKYELITTTALYYDESSDTNKFSSNTIDEDHDSKGEIHIINYKDLSIISRYKGFIPQLNQINNEAFAMGYCNNSYNDKDNCFNDNREYSQLYNYLEPNSLSIWVADNYCCLDNGKRKTSLGNDKCSSISGSRYCGVLNKNRILGPGSAGSGGLLRYKKSYSLNNNTFEVVDSCVG